MLVDISLHGPDGLDLLKIVRSEYPNLPVLILSVLDESLYAERALLAGASGYIMKQEATERVLTAIRRILAGEIYVSERMADRMLHRLVGAERAAAGSSVGHLTDRELEVFRLIGVGHGTREIARRPSYEREDGRVLSGAHKGKACPQKCAGTGEKRNRMGRKTRLRVELTDARLFTWRAYAYIA